MKFFAHLRFSLGLALLLAFGGVRAEAGVFGNGGFGLTVTYSTNLFFLNDFVSSTITVSNGTGQLLNNVYVTNDFTAPVLYTSFTNYYTATNNAYTNGNELSLVFSPMTNGDVATTTFVWQHLALGRQTNTVFVASDTVTNTASVTNVSRAYNDDADLGVSQALVSQAYVTNDFWAITNDWITYEVTVTNLGPGTALGVLLTNTLPAGTTLVSAGVNLSSNNLIYTVGSLAEGGTTNYQYTVEATNDGSFGLTATVGAPDLYDPNPANNSFTTQLFATNYLSGKLVALTNSAQVVNLQNGLLEQTIQVTNTGVLPVQAVRLVVGGLTNQLYDASGTNNRLPFVVYPVTLNSASRVSLRLQYAPRRPFPFTNGQLHAYEVPATVLNYTPPPVQTTTNFNYYRILRLSDGDVLLEFTNLGSSYTVVYSDNVRFANPRIATPVVQSQANRIQWLDFGPPDTISAPTNTVGTRYYKVILNP